MTRADRAGKRSRGPLAALVAAFTIVFIAATSSAGAAAYWTATAQPLTATVTSATTSVTASQTGLATTYRFAGAATSTQNIARGSMVFANTGTTPLTLTASLTANTAPVAANISIVLWDGAGQGCAQTPSAGVTAPVKLSASALPLPPTLTSVAPQSSVTVCAATTLDTTVAAQQGLSVSPVIRITGRVGTAWVTSGDSAPFVQKVYQVPNVGTITCTENPGTLTIAGTVTLSWAPVADANSYTLHLGSKATTKFRTVNQATPTVSTTIGAGDLGLTGVLSSVPVVVASEETFSGTSSPGVTVNLRTALLPLLSVRCPA